MNDTSILYFLKNEQGERIPFLTATGNKELLLENIIDKKRLEQITNDFPKSKNNIFALVDGYEFKLNG